MRAALEYRLRPATTSDTAFLFTLFHETRADAVEEAWGRNEAWQRRNFDARVDEHLVSIVEVEGAAAGSLWLDKRSDALHIADLQIVPDLQGVGIGTAVLQGLIARAAALGVPVELVVLEENERARRLYERLGFKVTSREAPFIQMRHDARRDVQRGSAEA
jgi:ribosomal protein S18 acetylase RimI-like enzyme